MSGTELLIVYAPIIVFPSGVRGAIAGCTYCVESPLFNQPTKIGWDLLKNYGGTVLYDLSNVHN